MARHGTSTEGRRPLSARRTRYARMQDVASECETGERVAVWARGSLSRQRARGKVRAMCGVVRREPQVLEAEVDERAFPLSLD
jgi:hypothetical protein